MRKMIIEGGQRLSGEVTIGGAKNSTVALIPAAILADTPVRFDSVPDILDVHNLMIILESMNVHSTFEDGVMVIDPTKIVENPLPSRAIKSLRASYYFMGSLLGKFNRSTVTFPGGDNIGPRPIDQHIKGFKALGASVSENEDTVYITADKRGLHGAHIFLDVVSVGATINVILAAVKARGLTTIENAAREPEIIDLAMFLNSMGAKVRGAGTDVIRIEGVEKLISTTTHTIIPDRIEAGTYLSLAAAVGNGITVKNIIPEHLESFTSKLVEAGIDIKMDEDQVYVPAVSSISAIEINTSPFPGFATDLQQPLTASLLRASGMSIVNDTIYPERVKHVTELKKMGAKIRSENGVIYVEHTDHLQGTEVEAGEIRAGACLMIAAFMAEGTTTITQADNIMRGYDSLIKKLTKLGAKVQIIEEPVL